MTHYEQALTPDGKPITYQWHVLEPTKPAPGCDEAFRIVADCSTMQDAKRISDALNSKAEYDHRNQVAEVSELDKTPEPEPGGRFGDGDYI